MNIIDSGFQVVYGKIYELWIIIILSFTAGLILGIDIKIFLAKKNK